MRIERAWMTALAIGGLWISLAACGQGGNGNPTSAASSTGAQGGGGSGTGGAGGATTGSGGATTGSGAGGAGDCKSSDDCTQLQGSECGVPTCNAGVCELDPLKAEGTITDSQLYGDCKRSKCDAAGAIAYDDDNTDKYDDGNPCTVDQCLDGAPIHVAQNAGVACGLNNAGKCDGNGQCVRCAIGGNDCPQNTVCVPTINHKDVYTLDPAINKCVPTSCTNGAKDNSETDIDCGGTQCAPCDDTKMCLVKLDCLNVACDGPAGMKTCSPTACNDGSLNGAETFPDCGGTCDACLDAAVPCKVAADCASGVCKDAKCADATCFDGVKNGDEAGMDCGGSCKLLCK